MAQEELVCNICKQPVVDEDKNRVEYECGHIEHRTCRDDYHPTNRTCIKCNIYSLVLFIYQ